MGKSKIDSWPKIKKGFSRKQKTKIAIQINGKTREVIEIEKNLMEKKVVSITKKSEKISKSLLNKKIIRIIFVKDKIINYLIK
mgnify:FL=1